MKRAAWFLAVFLLTGCGRTAAPESPVQPPAEQPEQREPAAGEAGKERAELRLRSTAIYNGTGELAGTAAYQYDETGHLLLEEIVYGDGSEDGLSGQTNVYVYDPGGNLIHEAVTVRGENSYTLSSADYDYDQAGNLLHRASQWEGSPNEETFYTYNAAGQLTFTRELRYIIGDPGSTESSTACTYDGRGRLIEEVRHTVWHVDEESLNEMPDVDPGPWTQTTACAYDGAGRLLRQTVTEKDGLPKAEDSFTCAYDEAGNLLKKSYDDVESEEKTYDEKGRLILETGRHYGYDMSNQDIIEYTYDEAGGYIRRTYECWGLYTEEQYDAAGLCVQIQYYRADGEKNERWVYTYEPAA